MKVLVIVASGLQTSALGCYGNEWLATPHLDRLAAEGVVFDQHFADAADVAGARRSWRTGRLHLPLAGAEPGAGDDLLSLLRRQDVATALIVDGERPGAEAFADGWKKVIRTSETEEESSLEQALDAAVAQLAKWARRDQWLLWLDLGPLLPPWHVPEDALASFFTDPDDEEPAEEEDEPAEAPTPLFDPMPGLIDRDDDFTFARLQRTYAGAVAYLDAGIGSLFEELDERGLAEELVVIVTADRGLPLGEHGEVGDARPWLHEERIHVPLLVRLPGAVARRVSAITQAVDLAPTLLDLFGVGAPASHGFSLLPLARGEVAEVRPYAVAGLEHALGAELCLRTHEWSLLLPIDQVDRARQIYVKPDDRFEVNDVSQHHLDRADQLEAVLRAFVAAAHGPGPLSMPPLPD
jgi:arylsulfatase A-like enzyme